MISAAQARNKTIERVRTLAQEFIINKVGLAVQLAVDKGEFQTTVFISDSSNHVAIGTEVARQLRCDHGYEAEFVQPDHTSDYILIKWGTN